MGKLARDTEASKRGRKVAIVIACVGVFWIVTFALGVAYNWPTRISALFDLIALAGFAFAIWMIYGLWQDSRKDGK